MAYEMGTGVAVCLSFFSFLSAMATLAQVARSLTRASSVSLIFSHSDLYVFLRWLRVPAMFCFLSSISVTMVFWRLVISLTTRRVMSLLVLHLAGEVVMCLGIGRQEVMMHMRALHCVGVASSPLCHVLMAPRA